MLIETLYIWIIWLILKLPQLEIKDTIDVEVQDEFMIRNAKSKYSLFHSFQDIQENKSQPQFKVRLTQNYLIVDNQTIIEYDKEYFRVQQLNNEDQSVCQLKRNHTYMKELLLNFSVINYSNCSIAYMDEQTRITNNDIKLSFTNCKDIKVIDQFNYFQKGQLVIIVCRVLTEAKIKILFYNNYEEDFLQLYSYKISFKELPNLFIRYQAHESKQFILIINAYLLHFTLDQIFFYKIDQVDEIQFSEDGTQLYAMRKSVIYQLFLQNPKVQLLELVEQQSKIKNSRILAFKCWNQGILVLTDKGYFKYLEVQNSQQIHKITIYDGIGVIMIMITLFSIKVNYF
ncbi:unnamed protein product (macronuclear) [Paramecium tetraurelia]|uniref:Transmembrane protein n=1 Tax=Paramecium tetraurelia TaxID=5888 RepID=A0BXE6_PARTE|nr:uncharacterized protein GSPATT00033066001 [Paramecium tetraurelia]CAK63213.1 unnamed protein product [Paramecium tetraurelia]|eukprot:XP_001430611.1 hypothetical protein (macronuclear) [Paramecium tetraurelia strain d4-2]